MDDKLIIRIKNSKPVRVVDYADSMESIADEYHSFVSKYSLPRKESPELYIEEIKKGSIEAWLLALDLGFRVIEHFNTIFDFAEHLKEIIYYGKKRDGEADTKSLRRVVKILTPVIKDNNSSIVINTVINGNNNTVINITSEEAKIIKEHCEQLLAERRIVADNRIRNDIWLRWISTDLDIEKRKGGVAIIESILPERPLVVIFKNVEDLKMVVELAEQAKMEGKIVLFNVDVRVEYIEGEPLFYYIEKYNQWTTFRLNENK